MAISFPRATRSFILTLGLALLISLGACHKRLSTEEKALRNELRLALRDHSYEKAVELAKRRVQSAKRDNGAWDSLVRAQIGLRDFAGARQTLVDWQRSVRKPPPRIDERAGDIASKENDPARAAQSWAKALRASPKNLRLLRKLARAYRTQEQWAAADTTLSAIIKKEETATARMERALGRRRLHRWSEALEDARRAQEIAPEDPDVRRGAKLFARLSKFLATIRELDARLAVNPDDDQTLADRALLLLRSEDPELALADAKLAAKKAPWAIRPRLFCGLALTELGRAEEAKKWNADGPLRLSALTPEFLETMSRLDSEISVENKNPDLYVARGWQLNEIGQVTLALEDAETALRYDANSAGALAERSYALAKLGRGAEALEPIRRATELNGNLAAAWQYRGELEMAQGDFAAAVDALSHALTIAPTTAALAKREQCYRQLGLADKADEDRHALEALSVR